MPDVKRVETVTGYDFNLHPDLRSDAKYVSEEDYIDAERRAQESESWAEFLARWVDFNHGSGESDRAWDEFKNGE